MTTIMRSRLLVATIVADIATRSVMIETFLQAMVHMEDLEINSPMSLAPAARVPSKSHLCHIHDAEYL
jgi:hypothetical protein